MQQSVGLRKKRGGIGNVDSCLWLVSRQHPDDDAGVQQRPHGARHTLLQAVLHARAADQR